MVVARGDNSFQQCEVKGFEKITAIYAGKDNTIVLNQNGKINVRGADRNRQCDAGDLSRIAFFDKIGNDERFISFNNFMNMLEEKWETFRVKFKDISDGIIVLILLNIGVFVFLGLYKLAVKQEEETKKNYERKIKNSKYTVAIDILAENSKKEAVIKANEKKAKKNTEKIDMLAETTREAAIIKAKGEAIKRKEKEERNIKIRANKEQENIRKKYKEINNSIINK